MEDKSRNTPIRIQPYIRHFSWLVVALIAGNKFLLRPWVINNFDHSFLLILVNSLPNFIEAVIGTVILSGIGLVLRARFPDNLGHIKDRSIYAIGTMIASIYVITQEFNVHSLGGQNVYDPYDVAASVIGLVFINVVFNQFGFLKPPAGIE